MAGPVPRVRVLADHLQVAPPLVVDGTWAQLLDALQASCDEAEGPGGRSAPIPAVVRAHQHAAGAVRPPAANLPAGAVSNNKNLRGGGTNREALDRSHSGLTTKIHLAADRCRRPITLFSS